MVWSFYTMVEKSLNFHVTSEELTNRMLDQLFQNLAYLSLGFDYHVIKNEQQILSVNEFNKHGIW